MALSRIAMHGIGVILHVAGSGRVIASLSEAIHEGQVLCDRDGTRVAKVMELIGPVRAPYASAAPLTNSIKKHVGKNVFAVTQLATKKKPSQQQTDRRSQASAQKTRRRRTR